MARLILINGMPGVGKSTLARRFAADHPGSLVCDVDLLRTFVSGWRDDFVGAGARIRPGALGLIRGYLRESGDVVLPQLLARTSELERFEKAAHDAGAEFVEVMLEAAEDDAIRRFHSRDDGDDPWHPIVSEIVAESGGDEHLKAYASKLTELLARRPATKVVPSVAGEVEATYASLRAALGEC